MLHRSHAAFTPCFTQFTIDERTHIMSETLRPRVYQYSSGCHRVLLSIIMACTEKKRKK